MRRRTVRGDGAGLREELLAAAHRIIDGGGDLASVTVRRVAEEAGVAVGTVYLHFASRDDLLFEAAQQHFGAHDEAVERELADLADPLERIARRGHAYLAYAREHPAMFHAYLMGDGNRRAPERSEGLASLEQTPVGAIIRDVQAAMDDGRIPAANARDAGLSLWFGVHGLASLLTANPDFPWPSQEALEAMLSRFQLAALRHPDEPVRPSALPHARPAAAGAGARRRARARR